MSVGELWTPHTHLPHPDFWLLNPDKDKIDTPITSQGLVDPYLLVKDVLSTLTSEFQPKLSWDKHHLYWPAYVYPQKTIERQFREIAPNKIRIPRDLHGWIHKVTLPPQKPNEELMYYHVEFYDAGRELFHAVRRIVQLQREKDSLLGKLPPRAVNGTIKSRQKGIANNRRRVEGYLEKLQRVPEEIMPIPIDVSANPKQIAQQLAVVALKHPAGFDSVSAAA